MAPAKLRVHGRCIAYYRVSTDRQGRSGLGLEAQRKTVSEYLKEKGHSLVGEFTEIESGKKNNRPSLDAALEACKRDRATLIVAKLDRLYRNVFFMSKLIHEKVDFVACDNPHATKLTIHMLAAFAEHEADLISQRTKAALAALKRRGKKLGAPNPRVGGKAAGAVHAANADKLAAKVLPIIKRLRKSGLSTYREIAAALNESGIKTQRGGDWYGTTVRNIEMRD